MKSEASRRKDGRTTRPQVCMEYVLIVRSGGEGDEDLEPVGFLDSDDVCARFLADCETNGWPQWRIETERGGAVTLVFPAGDWMPDMEDHV